MEEDGGDGGDWQMAFALPNLLLRDTIDFGDLALVGAGDARLIRIAETNPAAAALLGGFDHCLPGGSRPSAAIIRKGHRFSNPWEALVDARNLVALYEPPPTPVLRWEGGRRDEKGNS